MEGAPQSSPYSLTDFLFPFIFSLFFLCHPSPSLYELKLSNVKLNKLMSPLACPWTTTSKCNLQTPVQVFYEKGIRSSPSSLLQGFPKPAVFFLTGCLAKCAFPWKATGSQGIPVLGRMLRRSGDGNGTLQPGPKHPDHSIPPGTDKNLGIDLEVIC